MEDNPYQSPQSNQAETPDLNVREAYNITTDLVTGPNTRWKDNLYQAVAIFVFVLVGVVMAFVFIGVGAAPLLFGGFLGLVAGTFLSGLAIGLIRAVMHAKGKHH